MELQTAYQTSCIMVDFDWRGMLLFDWTIHEIMHSDWWKYWILIGRIWVVLKYTGS